MKNKSILITGESLENRAKHISQILRDMPSSARVIIVEDERRINIEDRDNIVRIVYDDKQGKPVKDLVAAGLRMRPDVLVVGDVRGAEAFKILIAAAAGIRCIASCKSTHVFVAAALQEGSLTDIAEVFSTHFEEYAV